MHSGPANSVLSGEAKHGLTLVKVNGDVAPLKIYKADNIDQGGLNDSATKMSFEHGTDLVFRYPKHTYTHTGIIVLILVYNNQTFSPLTPGHIVLNHT